MTAPMTAAEIEGYRARARMVDESFGPRMTVLRENMLRLLATIDAQRALLQRVSNTSASIPGNRLFYALPEDVVKDIDAALKESNRSGDPP